jgi:D-alanine-D-alanine ligase
VSGRVVVASGGRSLEREISLRSGRRATDALQQLGYDAIAIDPDDTFVSQVKRLRPDFVFVAMHGRGGEDGTLQDLLEILGVPYTGSDVHASARCLDKHLFKELVSSVGLATPPWHSFNRDAFAAFGAADTLAELITQLGFPLVVKPAREGSSLGIKFVHSSEEFSQAVVGGLSYDDRVVIEHYITGRELAVTVVGDADGPEVLPVVEIRTDEPFYTFRAHYDAGAAQLEVASLEPAVRARVEESARRAYAEAGCRDFARVDIILDRDEVPQILEINTIPGLTETGPARFAAEAAGMDFTAFVARIVSRAAQEAEQPVG